MEWLFLIAIGAALVTIAGFFWMGLPFFIYALITAHKQAPVRQLSMFTISSIPAVLESKSVYEFIQTLADQAKAAAYNEIMSALRKLLLDIKKHRGGYPEDIDALKQFVMNQIRFNIERSPVRTSIETAKFRDLAEMYCLTEVMQEIYVADCKAARSKLPKEAL